MRPKEPITYVDQVQMWEFLVVQLADNGAQSALDHSLCGVTGVAHDGDGCVFGIDLLESGHLLRKLHGVGEQDEYPAEATVGAARRQIVSG